MQFEPSATLGNTMMFEEAASSARVVECFIATNDPMARDLAAELQHLPPALVLGVGRGSSGHAGVYAKYLIEQRLGIPTASAGLSLGSVYKRPVACANALCLALSQSGRSPDLLASVALAAQGGARTLALTNDAASPLALAADDVMPLCAGPEISVAATKSFVASLAGIALLVAHWAGDTELRAALAALPEALDRAWAQDWSPLVERLQSAGSLVVLGRGPSYATAREAALKLKETCALHAESFSSAEVLHGPAALIRPSYPVLAFAQNDAALPGIVDTLKVLCARGADVYVAGVDLPGTVRLPTLDLHPLLQPITSIVSFYRAANALSLALGRDPDRPPHLAKVTETT